MKQAAICLALVAASSAANATRPASLDIAADCGAIPDDGLDDTAAIRACLALEPRELVIPIGVFEVNTTASNQSAALEVRTSDMIVRGEGPGSVTRIIRGANGFSQTRVWGVSALTVDVERVTFRDFTIDGARDAWTCVETKHTPGASDGKGEQQHGIFIQGQGATARDVTIERMNFVGLSGDAIYVYQSVEDFRLTGQTVGGYCRAGIAFNAYTDCTADLTQGMRRVTLSRNTFLADVTAPQGARGIDIEPNANVCDFLLADNAVDEIEVGSVVRLRVEGNTVVDIGLQLAGSIGLVSARDFIVRNNTVNGSDVVTPPIYIRKSHIGLVEGNRVRQPYPVEGIAVSNNGSSPSSDIQIRRNRVEYTGAGIANAYAIFTQGIEGRLDVVGNEIPPGWKNAVQVFGAGDALISGNVWDVAEQGIKLRSTPGGFLEVSQALVEGNRGTALYILQAYGAIGTLRDCGNTSTGGITMGGNTLTPCSLAEEQAATDITSNTTRIEALEGAP